MPRIVAGPTWLPVPRVWEVTVSIPVYSAKLAYKTYRAMPETITVSGYVYRKAGMHAADCIAWYRRN